MTNQLQTTQPKPVSKDLPKDVRGLLASDYVKTQIALCLPQHMTPERFLRVALNACMRNPKLMQCEPMSVVKCCLDCSSLGLEPDSRRAHLIPFGRECTLIVDYKGLVELAMNSGTVSSVFAELVCEKDSFTWDTGEIHHTVDWRKPRGDMYAVYCLIKFKDGGQHTEVMTKYDVDRIRKRSKAANNGPWVTDYDEMSKKTVFRRASKWVKLSPEVVDALEKVEEAPIDLPLVSEIEMLPEATDGEPASEAPAETPTPRKPRGKAQETISPPPVNPPQAGGADLAAGLQSELARMVNDGGYDFDTFRRWAEESGNIPDAMSLTSWAEISDRDAKRFVGAKAGLLAQLEATKKGNL